MELTIISHNDIDHMTHTIFILTSVLVDKNL